MARAAPRSPLLRSLAAPVSSLCLRCCSRRWTRVARPHILRVCVRECTTSARSLRSPTTVFKHSTACILLPLHAHIMVPKHATPTRARVCTVHSSHSVIQTIPILALVSLHHARRTITLVLRVAAPPCTQLPLLLARLAVGPRSHSTSQPVVRSSAC